MLAWYVECVFRDDELAMRFSKAAHEEAARTHDRERNLHDLSIDKTGAMSEGVSLNPPFFSSASVRVHSDKAGIAKVVEPAKLDGLLAGTRADGSFFKLPEDCQLVEAAFCVASEDNDRDMISAEDDGKLLERWRRDSGRARLRTAVLGGLCWRFRAAPWFFVHGL